MNGKTSVEIDIRNIKTKLELLEGEVKRVEGKVLEYTRLIQEHDKTIYGCEKKGEKGLVYWNATFIKYTYMFFGGCAVIAVVWAILQVLLNYKLL